MTAELPERELLERQAAWLEPARARLLRRAAIGRRRKILEVGSGHGVVTSELVRRCPGEVVALDRAALPPVEGATRVRAEAQALPFGDGEFDLVFFQCALLWMPLERVLEEAHRVLEPNGVLVAIEPDYGGMIEHPPQQESREIWISGLRRAGADPLVGRKIPGVLEALGFSVRVDLFAELLPPDPARFELLSGLPLNEIEQARLRHLTENQCQGWGQLCHLPYFLVSALR